MTSWRSDVVTDDGALDALASEWDALLAVTPEASGFHAHAWVASCRAGLHPGRRALRALVVRERGEMVGIVPLEIDGSGRLAFVGDAVANYAGPVYRPDRVAAVLAALHELLADRRVGSFDFRGLRDGSPFLAGLVAEPPPGWTVVAPIETATCPYVDLAGGWPAVLARHSAKSRSTLARKARLLERLGPLALVDDVGPADVADVLPALFRLFSARWAGRHESGGFAGRHREFHARALPRLAAAGHLRLSLLRVDGEVAAFAYGLCAAGVTSSYVLAHDDALGEASPGAVLLARLLETACRRGDPSYDFSIGEESYKAQWATGRRGVFRVVGWRRGAAAGVTLRLSVAGSRLWVAARSRDGLRRLRREGLRRMLFAARTEPPDAPGLPAGPVGTWHAYRLSVDAPGAEVVVERWRWGRMAAALSPRHRGIAATRAMRGDVLLALARGGRLAGVVWQAADARRARVAGPVGLEPGEPVFYHPASETGLDALVAALARSGVAARSFVLVTPAALGARAPLASFPDDVAFRSAS